MQLPNALDNLVAQIRLLIQQMQVALAPQVNYNAPNYELNLVHYLDFVGGDQDPMTWLNKVEKAFASNLVNNDHKIAVIVPYLKGAAATWWSTSQRQPQPLIMWNDLAQPNQRFHSNFIMQFRTSMFKEK